MEFTELIHAKINGLWWGAHIWDWLIDSLAICDWFILILDMHIIILCLITNLVFDSALWLVVQVHIHSHPDHSLYIFWFSYVHDWFEYPLTFHVDWHVSFILLVETRFRDLEGCYSLYRTFPISNLTLEPDLVFHRPLFQKQGVTLRVFLSYFVYPLKIKQK